MTFGPVGAGGSGLGSWCFGCFGSVSFALLPKE
jgi:hypothetical protein